MTNPTISQLSRGASLVVLILICCVVHCCAQEYLPSERVVPNELLVRVVPGTDLKDLFNQESKVPDARYSSIFPSLGMFRVRLSAESDLEECADYLRSDSRVISVRRNRIMTMVTTATPDDPSYSSQYALQLIEAHRAWDISTGGVNALGDEIVVAVLDDGFDLSHPDLNFWINEAEVANDGIDDDGNGYIDDVKGWNASTEDDDIVSAQHGTHVAGIVGARGNNGIGITGVNWNVKIMAVQVFNGSDLAESDILDGYNYILSNRLLYDQSDGEFGAFIVATNASFSKAGWQPEDYTEWCEIFDALGTAGILNVGTAQNQSVEIDAEGGFPPPPSNFSMPAMCSSPYLVVVTNTNSADELADDAPWSVEHFDIAAPGVSILSTVPGGTGLLSGVSMAAPLVAGTVALIHAAACESFAQAYSNNPAQVTLNIRSAIVNRADFVPGLLLLIGGGRLNVYNSVRAFMEEHVTNRTITGNLTAPLTRTAINEVEIHDFTSSTDVLVRAGHTISIAPNSSLTPNSESYQLYEVSPAYYECAVPYEPLGLGLYAPSTAYCGTPLGVACNAVVSGGVGPYTFAWRSRLHASNDWYNHNSSVATCIVFRNDDFVVDVRVTDALGNTAVAGPALVACIQGMVKEDNHSLYAQDEVKVQVWPNPSNGTTWLRASVNGQEESASILIVDGAGRVLESTQVSLEGGVSLPVSVSLVSGAYYAVVVIGEYREVERFIILRE